MTALDDLDKAVSTELSNAHTAPLRDTLDEVVEGVLEGKTNVFSKIRFNWRKDDRAIIERIESAVDAQFVELFSDAITAVDKLYESMRVPETTAAGITVIGPDGRPVWKKGPDGLPIETLSQLTGQDVDEAILGLQRVLFAIQPQVSKLKFEAIAAHHIAKDTYDDAWFSLVEGTQGDRTARANTESRVDRWHSYFRFCLWESANSFVNEINALLSRLDRVSYRLSRAQQ